MSDHVRTVLRTAEEAIADEIAEAIRTVLNKYGAVDEAEFYKLREVAFEMIYLAPKVIR